MSNEKNKTIFSDLHSLIDWQKVTADGRGHVEDLNDFGIVTDPCPGEAGSIVTQLISLGLNKEDIKLVGKPSTDRGTSF